jgi:hypothetical protein
MFYNTLLFDSTLSDNMMLSDDMMFYLISMCCQTTCYIFYFSLFTLNTIDQTRSFRNYSCKSQFTIETLCFSNRFHTIRIQALQVQNAINPEYVQGYHVW